MADDPAQTLIAKLQRFTADELDDEERTLFARLMAPGLSAAYEGEVRGFDADEARVPSLAEALRSLGE